MSSETLASFADYWFGKYDDASRWFYEGFHHDDEVERFRPLFEAVDAGHVAPTSIDEHALAIMVLDQLPRHLFRHRPEAYAWDARSLALARGMYDRGWHAELDTWLFIFWSTPFEHAEDLAEHAFVRPVMTARIEQHPPGSEDRAHLEKARLYLDKHTAVLRRFGRYPKRVEVRGDPLTEAEARYLAGRVGKPY